MPSLSRWRTGPYYLSDGAGRGESKIVNALDVEYALFLVLGIAGIAALLWSIGREATYRTSRARCTCGAFKRR